MCKNPLRDKAWKSLLRALKDEVVLSGEGTDLPPVTWEQQVQAAGGRLFRLAVKTQDTQLEWCELGE